MLTRALLYIGVVSLSTLVGFLIHALLSAPAVGDLSRAVVYWQRRAKRAEAEARLQVTTSRFTYDAPMSKQRQGLRVVEGGKR